MDNSIEVVGPDMMCFKVAAGTLEPLTCSTYQPAAWNDPRGRQMTLDEWNLARAEIRSRSQYASSQP